MALGWRGPGAGPFQQRWREIGGITVVAVGAYGEMSRSLQALVARATECGAARHWRRHGCRTEREARSVVATKLTTRLGIAFVRAQAKLVHSRVHLAERGGAERERLRRARASYSQHLADVHDHRAMSDYYGRPQRWRDGR